MGVRLPAEYQEVEYIQGRITDNPSYIDTRYIPSVNTKLRVKFSPENKNGSGYFGARFDPYRFYCVTFANGEQLSCGMTINAWPSTRLPLVFNDIYDATIANGQSNINGTVINTALIDASQWSETVGTIQLKAAGTAALTPNSTAKYYLCQIWENDELVRDFVPCYRKSDDEIGMYELVTREFYTNAGTSAFSKGPDVIDSISPWLVARRRMLMQKQLIGYTENVRFGNKDSDLTVHEENGWFITGFVPLKDAIRLYIKYASSGSYAYHTIVTYDANKNPITFWNMNSTNGARTVVNLRNYGSPVYVRLCGVLADIAVCMVKNSDTNEILWQKGM